MKKIITKTLLFILLLNTFSCSLSLQNALVQDINANHVILIKIHDVKKNTLIIDNNHDIQNLIGVLKKVYRRPAVFIQREEIYLITTTGTIKIGRTKNFFIYKGVPYKLDENYLKKLDELILHLQAGENF